MKRYSILNFVIDALLTALTGGFWLIYVVIREMRNRNRAIVSQPGYYNPQPVPPRRRRY